VARICKQGRHECEEMGIDGVRKLTVLPLACLGMV
jgi:hypothetical protein